MIRLYHGDNNHVLKSLEDNTVDSIITDPPYGLKFMGKKWDYSVPSVEQWKQCLRVLKPGGHLLSFAGTRTQHRMCINIEDAGFEIRDMIAWVYGSGFPKSHNLHGDWEGWGTTLKPALEPITVARKPLVGTIAENTQRYGTGAININDCRVEGEPWSKTYGDAENTKNCYGEYKKRTEQTFSNDAGRWPANLIHDGSNEVIELFPNAKGQQGKAKTDFSKKNNTVYGALRNYTTTPEPRKDVGSAARFFYCAKASKQDRDEGINDSVVKNLHPTVKPTMLMQYLCRLITPMGGGVVLDPWMGSGSTGKAAVLEWFQFIGVESNEDYINIAKERINHVNILDQIEIVTI